jgi:hypothetical protein
MLTVAFLPVELRSLDKLRADVLLLSMFEDERPLRGVAGLVDWRTCGMLSRFLRREHVTGASGEIVLFPPGPKLGVERGLVMGLGAVASYDENRFEAVIEEAAVHLRKLRLKTVAMAMPGTHLKRISTERAVGALVDATLNVVAQVTLFASTAERREITDALRRRQGELEVAVGGTQAMLARE